MGTLIHIAEVAGLLFVAYVVGWLIGYIAHRIAVRLPRAATVPADRLAAAKGETPPPEDALVKAPVVVAVSSAPPPPAPVSALATPLEPVRTTATPDGLAPAAARPMELTQSTKVATPISGLDSLKTLSTSAPLMTPELASAATPAPVSEPMVAEAAPADPVEAALVSLPEAMVESEPVMAVTPKPVVVTPEIIAQSTTEPEPGPEPIAQPEPIAEPEPPAVELAPSPMPATRPGVAWAGAIGGREAAPFEQTATPEVLAPVAQSGPAVAEAPTEPAPQPIEPETVEVPAFNVEILGLIADKLKQVEDLDQSAPASPEIVDAVTDELPQTSEPVAVELTPAIIPEPEPVVIPEATPEPAASAPAPKSVPSDEDAAMRAIEGGWSRRASRALSGAPEMTDVSAAVSAAQVAVEQVLARNGVDAAGPETRAQAAFGKPRGLPAPRLGGRDNLKQIKGLSPLDESTLNNMGIYHFDQIAAWDQKEVLWLENHAFARGRIGREDWQAQANELLRGADSASGGR